MRTDLLLFEEFLRASVASKPAFRLLPVTSDPKPPDPVDLSQSTRRRKPTPDIRQPQTFKILGKDGQITMGAVNLQMIVGLASMILPRRTTVPAQWLLRLDSDHSRVRAFCRRTMANHPVDLVDPNQRHRPRYLHSGTWLTSAAGQDSGRGLQIRTHGRPS